MMLALSFDVANDAVDFRMTHRERSASRLPAKARARGGVLLDPARRGPFQLLHPFSKGDATPQAADQMDVVFNAADSQWRTPKRLGYAAQLTVHFFAKFIVDKKPLTILRRKHKMDGDVGQ